MAAERDKRFSCPCCGRNWIDPRVKCLVSQIEQEIGEELVISSGYRCEKHNREVGGSETSSHPKGLAVDLECERSRLRYKIVGAAIILAVTRIGVRKDFIHLDIDRQKPTRLIWIY